MTRFVGIDPSTKTGLVALNEDGQVLIQKEIKGIGSEDPRRMVTLIDEIISQVREGDLICIEGFPYETQRAMFAGGLHWGIRNALYRKNLNYYEVAPNAVKKFVAVSGWTGVKGSKRRLTGPQKKQAVKEAVIGHFGFMHKSDNVVDAYILARIAREIWLEGKEFQLLPPYQSEVIQTVLGGSNDG